MAALIATVVVVISGIAALGLLDWAANKAAVRVGLGVLGVLLLASGAYLGLFWAPPEREMGDVQRIMYVHVPSVWMALLCCTLNFAASVRYLFRPSGRADAFAEAGAEVGVVVASLGVLLGSIWGRPTWGVWWDWDPRLTTAAICIVSYAGYLALRRFIEDPEKRAVWSAVVGIVAYVDIPIIWFSVKWWNSLHQVQSSPKTVDPQMTFALRWNAFAFLALTLAFIAQRVLIALERQTHELTLPEPQSLEVAP